MVGHGNWPDGSGLPVPLMFAGGAFDGTNVWLLPESADRLVYINARTHAMGSVAAWPYNYTAGDFQGGVFDAASGLIWLAPYGVKAPVVSVDVATHVMSSYAPYPAWTPPCRGRSLVVR